MKKCIIDIETSTFIPWEPGRIICIGTKNIQTREIQIFYDENEEKLLIDFLRYFNKRQFQQIIGYNISYDIRYIFSRCLKYNIQAPQFMHAKPTDLMAILKGPILELNYNKPGTLNQWSQLVLQKSKLYHNTEIPDLYHAGKIQEIIRYNEKDLEITYELYNRIQNIIGGA